MANLKGAGTCIRVIEANAPTQPTNEANHGPHNNAAAGRNVSSQSFSKKLYCVMIRIREIVVFGLLKRRPSPVTGGGNRALGVTYKLGKWHVTHGPHAGPCDDGEFLLVKRHFQRKFCAKCLISAKQYFPLSAEQCSADQYFGQILIFVTKFE